TTPPPTQNPPLSLHDALPICKKPLTIRHIKNTKACGCFTGNLLATISPARRKASAVGKRRLVRLGGASSHVGAESGASSRNLQRSEEHTSELQSLRHLVCRLL